MLPTLHAPEDEWLSRSWYQGYQEGAKTHRATVLKMCEAPDKPVQLSADLQPVSSSMGLLKDLFGEGCRNRAVISQLILISCGITNVHCADVIAFLHHDHAPARVQRQLEIFGQSQK